MYHFASYVKQRSFCNLLEHVYWEKIIKNCVSFRADCGAQSMKIKIFALKNPDVSIVSVQQ